MLTYYQLNMQILMSAWRRMEDVSISATTLRAHLYAVVIKDMN